MQINLIADSSVSLAPAGFTTAVQAAAEVFDEDFPGNYTVNIRYGWGTYDNVADDELTSSSSGAASIGGTLGGDDETYATVKSWLAADASLSDQKAAVASLPANYTAFPDDADDFYVSTAQEKALGVFTGSGSAVDGAIGFNTSDPSDTEFEGLALCEIGHALGWESGLGQATIMGLFRYDSPGQYQWTSGQPAYFSVDGGMSDLANFATSFDPTLFENIPGDPFSVPQLNSPTSLTSLDIEVLNDIGFGGAPKPPPQLTITNTTVLTNQTAQTISGTIDVDDAGLTVSIYDGTTLLGTATPAANGDWKASITLPSTSSELQSITAQATNAFGEVGVSDTASYWVGDIYFDDIPYSSANEYLFYASTDGGTLQIVDAANADAILTSFAFVGAYSGEIFEKAPDLEAAGTDVDIVAAPYVSPQPGDVVVSNISGQAYSAYEIIYDAGVYTGVDYIYPISTNVVSQHLAAYVYDYSAGVDFVGSKFFYSGVSGQNYTEEEVDYDGGGNVTRVALIDDTVDPFSSYAYDYVGGVFAGSKFTYTKVPAGARYSSYEVDYDQNNKLLGDRFFFDDVVGQSYKDEEEDFDANGHLSRVLLTGVSGQAYSSLEEDFSEGSYTGYKAFYKVTGRSFTSEEVDVNASDAITKVVYSGLSGAPYSSVEQDYSNGALEDVVYSFTNVSGANAYAYQVTDNASGAGLQETFDNRDGSHRIIGLANNQTLTSIGDDRMTGGGSGATFLLNAVYGHDTITDFSTYATGASHDTISLPSVEFANFAAVKAAATNFGGGVLIRAVDGDTLTLQNLDTTTLAGLGADFTFHG